MLHVRCNFKHQNITLLRHVCLQLLAKYKLLLLLAVGLGGGEETVHL